MEGTRKPSVAIDKPTTRAERTPTRATSFGAEDEATKTGMVIGRKEIPASSSGSGKSTRTHHFGVLPEAGLIERRRDGTRKLTSLRREQVDAKFPGLLDTVLAPIAA